MYGLQKVPQVEQNRKLRKDEELIFNLTLSETRKKLEEKINKIVPEYEEVLTTHEKAIVNQTIGIFKGFIKEVLGRG